MATPPDAATELLHSEMARFPRARLVVFKGPDKGSEVLLEGQTVVVGSDEACELRLTDPAVSRRHLELSGGPDGYRLRDLRSTNGVLIDGVQVHAGMLVGKARLQIGRTELRFEPERHEVQWPLSSSDRFGEAYGRSTAMRRVFALLERAAATASGLVLEGETGTGRELLAREVHGRSVRKDGPFVVVDVGALGEAALDADLFGRELVPFGRAGTTRPGALEEASGGTLYLDEVSALPTALQARLARALEARELRRGNDPVPVDVRPIASSSKDLEREVRAGRFREDLFFQLAVFRVRVPSLRERLEDVPALVRLFEARRPNPRPIPPEALEMLSRHDWPGNVRELRSVVERLAAFPDFGRGALEGVLGMSAQAEPAAAEPQLGAQALEQLFTLPYHDAKERVLDSFEKGYLQEHLRAANGVVTRAAAAMGLPRQSVHRMLRRLGLGGHDES